METVTTWTFCAVVEMLDTLLAGAHNSEWDRQHTRGDAGHDGKSCCCELHFVLNLVFFFVDWRNESVGEFNFVRNLVLSSVLLSDSRWCRR